MNKVIVICGQTSTGKSDLAVELALKYGGEVISCDSRQVYCELNLLSGKITDKEMKGVKHHLLDIASLSDLPNKPVTVALFQKLARAKIEEITTRGNTPILCGGTGLYIDAVINEKYEFGQTYPLTPSLEGRGTGHSNTEESRVEAFPQEKVAKPDRSVTWIGLSIPMPELRERIKQRILKRIELGMIEELQQIINSGISFEVLESLGLETKYIGYFLQNKISYNEMIETLSVKTGQYAKRQMTWFKRNKDINWINPTENNLDELIKILN